MQKFYNSLSEKDRRRYAGIEAMKSGRGGIVYVSKVLKCSRKTVSKGIRELNNLPSNIGYQKRIRRTGGGRRNYHQVYPHIDDFFLDIIKNYTAGDPMKEGMLWTNLSYQRISDEISKKYGIRVSTKVSRQLIKKHEFGKRKLKKKSTMKQVKNRNAQFKNIVRYKGEYWKECNPIMSMDSKKKEEIGNFYRSGSVYSQAEIPVYDHDFTSFSEGKVIPHGIYDVVKNKGWINIGTSKDTSEFACDSLREWWYNYGIHDYPQASSILILCDGGGSNSSRHYIFKEDLQKLADEIQIEIRIAHYPPYTSKYNPIEHRMFPHVTRACRGAVFGSVEYVKELMEKTETKKGLDVTVNILDKVYQTGRKTKENFKKNMPIVFDKYLSAWNYRAIPNG
ncbi:MAG: ISAzo13 family transposase [Lentisphaerae bacterium]|nr:ISAzo13 family transposase [Lentisphaerota bacterium]